MVANVVDITDGAEFKIVGTGADIDRVQQACKRALRKAEENRSGLDAKLTVVIEERDKT